MKRKYLCAAMAAVLALSCLAGCGKTVGSLPAAPDPGTGTSASAEAPEGRQPDQGSGPGYTLDVEPNTAVLDSLLADYDRRTAVQMDASEEMSVMSGAHSGDAGGAAQDAGQDAPAVPQEPAQDPGGQDPVQDDVPAAPVALSAEPAPLPLVLTPTAPGTAAMSNANCTIDYSNSADGYFMARWNAAPQKIKIQSTGPSGVTYTYDLAGNAWSAFPFSDGNGGYSIRILQNIGGTKYAVSGSVDIQVAMNDQFAPFLRPNQYVNYENAPAAMAQASECCRGRATELDKVAGVYDWVVANLSYDRDKARTVQSGYLPDLDSVMAARKGICFDYASLMAAMLRSQGVACRLVVGYAGSAYHAWISVYVDGQGWVDGVVFFDGTSWQRMDPTFASSANNSDAIKQYIGDGSHYSAMYLY